MGYSVTNSEGLFIIFNKLKNQKYQGSDVGFDIPIHTSNNAIVKNFYDMINNKQQGNFEKYNNQFISNRDEINNLLNIILSNEFNVTECNFTELSLNLPDDVWSWINKCLEEYAIKFNEINPNQLFTVYVDEKCNDKILDSNNYKTVLSLHNSETKTNNFFFTEKLDKENINPQNKGLPTDTNWQYLIGKSFNELSRETKLKEKKTPESPVITSRKKVKISKINKMSQLR